MASSSHFRSDATLGMSHYGGDALALEKILGKLNINDGISPKIVDEMAMALKGRLNINVNDEFTRNMAMNVIEERLKTMRVSTATTTSPPPRHQSPRRANSSRDIPGCLPQQLRRPPSPRPSSPLPRAFKVTTSQDSRGRSPSRSRSSGAKVKDQSRSITPNRNVFFGRMKPSVAPETTNSVNAATSNTNRSSSRSPRRGRSQSPLQRIFGGNGATRYEKCPNEAASSSPSVYYEAHSTEESLLESRTPPVSERGSQRPLTPSQRPLTPSQRPLTPSGRPPLAAVNMDPSPTGNIMSPTAQANNKREAGPLVSGLESPKANTPTTHAAFSPNQPVGGDPASSRFNFDPNGDRFHIGTSPAKAKKGSPNRIKSPTHHRGLRSSPRKLNVGSAQSQNAAPPSATQPTTPHDTFQTSFDDPTEMLSPPTPYVKPQSFDPFFKRLEETSTAQSFAKMDISEGGHLDTGISAGKAPFASPTPPFQPPVAVFAETGPIRRPPNEREGNPSKADMMGRRQTAPPQMAFAAASVSASMGQWVPNTPLDSAVPNLQPDSVPDTCLNKKTRNTSTPSVGYSDPPKFNVDLGANMHFAKQKAKVKRGANLRKGLGGRSCSMNHGASGLGDIPPATTDDTSRSTSASETSGESNAPAQQAKIQVQFSPSNASVGSEAMSIDSPHPTRSAETQKVAPSVKHAAPASNIRFNIGVGDSGTPTGVRKPAKRRENAMRRGNQQRSQSMHNVHTANVSNSNDISANQPSSTASASLGHNFLGAQEIPQCGRPFGGPGANPIAQPGLSEKHEKLNMLRERGKASYNEKAYQQSIVFNTEGIQLFHHISRQHPSQELLAVLFSNRAAALMMVGAFEAAADDCRSALQTVSGPIKMSDYSGAPPLLIPRLHARMGRAFLRLGRVEDADKEFGKAIESSKNLAECTTPLQDKEWVNKMDQVTTDSTLGKAEANRLREILAKIAEFNEQCLKALRMLGRNATINVLNDVNAALLIASGCSDLHQMKVKLLADLKRWREVASHSERLASSTVLFDGCFVGDLATKNPVPSSAAAKYLRCDFFDSAKENDLEECQKILTTSAAREAVLRLPYAMIPLYIRSLRLEERYSAAEVCLLTLEQFVTENVGGTGREGLRSSFSWLPREKDKLIRTKLERKQGDEFYQYGKYEEAAEKYAACLLVDFEGVQFSDGAGAGGRLHAVLHCNRAACLMALKRNHEALTECTSALRIHSRYMKAKLRRARCYTRLEQYEEATEEFTRWLEMVRQTRTDPNNFSSSTSPCIFDGPETVNAKEEYAVRQELDELFKSMAAAERSHAAYEHQRGQWQRDRFDSSYTSRNNDAQRRREYFHSNQSSSRRWDSFTDRGPNRSRSGKTNSKAENVKTSQNERPIKSPREYADTDSHYDVLHISINATISDIKKAYRTMARIYHPDKNSDPTAVENFRRVQLAQEALMNPESRRQHDSHLRWRRR